MEKLKIDIADTVIEYFLELSSYQGIKLIVYSDTILYVKCSYRLTLEKVEECIRLNHNWIMKKMAEAKGAIIIKKDKIYSTGERFFLFGEEKTLLICYGKKDEVMENGDCIIVWTPDINNTTNANSYLYSYFRRELDANIMSFYNKYVEAEPILECNDIGYRSMTKILGQCLCKEKKLLFSQSLYAFSLPIIEYIVLHELMHLLQPNHSPKFYAEVAKRMSDYKERKKMIKKYTVTDVFH